MVEKRKYKKGFILREFTIKDGRVLAHIVLNGQDIFNPTIEEFLASGWEEA